MIVLRRAVAACLLLLVAAGCAQSQQKPGVASAGAPAPSSSADLDPVTAYVEGVRAFVACMRQSGVDITDPDAKGRYDVHIDSKTDPTYLAAAKKCTPLLPPVPKELQYRDSPEQVATFQRYAKCMQTHGAPDYPDPDPEGYGSDTMWIPGTDAARRALRECGYIIGEPNSPGPAKG